MTIKEIKNILDDCIWVVYDSEGIDSLYIKEENAQKRVEEMNKIGWELRYIGYNLDDDKV